MRGRNIPYAGCQPSMRRANPDVLDKDGGRHQTYSCLTVDETGDPVARCCGILCLGQPKHCSPPDPSCLADPTRQLEIHLALSS
jgi:hypothetical protein